MKPQGFTLVEVLVALAISAVALLAALKLVSTTVQSLAESELRSSALRCADEAVALARLNPNASGQIGEREQQCRQAGREFRVAVRVSQSPHLNFRRMETLVYEPAGRVVAQRLAFIPVNF